MVEYKDYPPEELELTDFQFTSGEIKAVVITYTNWEPEELEMTAINFTSGTLT